MNTSFVRWLPRLSLVLGLLAACEPEPSASLPPPACDPCAHEEDERDAGEGQDKDADDDEDLDQDESGDEGDDEVLPACPDEARASESLCIWADEGELAKLLAAPDARDHIASSVGLAGRRYDDVEFELHGGSARTWPKKSFRLRFAEARPVHDFFGDGAQKVERVVLQAAYIDPTFLRAKLLFDVLRELGALAPRVGYTTLYVNGRRMGLYQVIERIDEHFLERHGLSRDGLLYKAESHSADFGVHDAVLAGFANRSERPAEPAELKALFEAVANTPASHEAFEREVESRIDLEDFALWNMVMSYGLNLDTFTKNYYLYRAPTRAAKSAPFRVIHWDADTSFGLWWTGSRYEEPEQAELYGARNRLAARLYRIPAYLNPYLARFAALLDGPLAAAAMKERARVILERIEPDVRADLAEYHPELDFDAERAFLDEMFEVRERVMRAAMGSLARPRDASTEQDDRP